MQILLLCGSNATKSHTRTHLLYLKKLLQEQGITTVLWDFRAKPVPIAIPEFHNDPIQNPDPNVKELITTVAAFAGIILGSPLYHGSYSGVLKNALDNLPYDAFRNKPVGLISNGSNIRLASNPCEHLRLVTRALFGYVTQTQVGTANKDFDETADGLALVSDEVKKRSARLIKELIAFATVLTSNPINS